MDMNSICFFQEVDLDAGVAGLQGQGGPRLEKEKGPREKGRLRRGERKKEKRWAMWVGWGFGSKRGLGKF
jgi:hypothetical protein